MKKQSVRNLALAGLMGALVLLLTYWPHIPVGNGYVHLGDTFIYVAAVILPLPYGLAVAAVGASLADCLSGYPLWAPATLVIKALTVLLFNSKSEKLLCLRNCLAPIGAGVLCAGGYYLYEGILYGNFVAPIASIPGNILQSLCSAIIFFILAGALRNRKPFRHF